MPYVFGLRDAANAFISAGFGVHFTVAVCVLAIILAVCSQYREKDDAPVHLPGHALLDIYPFFRRRYDFLNWGFQATGQSVFQFRLLRVRSPRYFGPASAVNGIVTAHGCSRFRRIRKKIVLRDEGV
jgi:sterol 14-demethylase